jgi:hypothetical protein
MTPFPSQVAGVVENKVIVQVGSFAYTGEITMVDAEDAGTAVPVVAIRPDGLGE